MTIKQWMYNTVLLRLPQPHLCSGKLPPKSPSLQGISVLARSMESWNFRLLNRISSVTGHKKNPTTLILCDGSWGVKNMNGINVIIIGVFQEDLPQNPGECEHLSSTTLRAKETISIGSANSKEKMTTFLLKTALQHKLPQRQCHLSTFPYRLWRSW